MGALLDGGVPGSAISFYRECSGRKFIKRCTKRISDDLPVGELCYFAVLEKKISIGPMRERSGDVVATSPGSSGSAAVFYPADVGHGRPGGRRRKS